MIKNNLIYGLNLIIEESGGEILFYGTFIVGGGAVLKLNKNKAYIQKDIPLSKDTVKEFIVYFDDFIEIYGEAKFFELYELARLKISNYKEIDVLEMDYNFLLHYNSYSKKYACIHRDDLKYYFGAGKDFLHAGEIRVGYGNIAEEAIKEASKYFKEKKVKI